MEETKGIPNIPPEIVAQLKPGVNQVCYNKETGVWSIEEGYFSVWLSGEGPVVKLGDLEVTKSVRLDVRF